MTTRLESFRNHCRRMSEAEHKSDCPMLTAVEPYWPPGGWELVDEDGNWCARSGKPSTGLGWLGPKPAWSPPHCDGCMPTADRELFRTLSTEVDAYLGDPTLEDA